MRAVQCKVDGCTQRVCARGYCNKHYLQMNKHGKITDEIQDKVRQAKNSGICMKDGCKKYLHSHGLCAYHLKLRNQEKKLRICKVNGCKNKHYGKGYCSKHYQQVSRHGRIIDKEIHEKNNIAGKIFGKLTVVRKTNKKAGSSYLWLCLCSCGTEHLATSSNLKNGNVKSCGCIRSDAIRDVHHKIAEKYIGESFGSLTVVSILKEANKHGRILAKCSCACGKETITSLHGLKNGTTQSCGCKRNACRTLPPGNAARNALLYTYKTSNAKKRNLEWELSNKDFYKLTSRNCFYCGAAPSSVKYCKGYNGSYIYNGIDRVDNSKGYSRDNCVSCCFKCNNAKRNMTLKEFLTYINTLHTNLCSIVAPGFFK